MPSTRKTLATAAIALPLLFTGCLYYPTVTAYSDPTCNVNRHKLELGVDFLGDKGNPCGNLGPADCLAGWMMMSSLTFAVSGSIVVAGNSILWLEKTGEVYWLKKRGKCPESPPAQQAGKPAGQASADHPRDLPVALVPAEFLPENINP